MPVGTSIACASLPVRKTKMWHAFDNGKSIGQLGSEGGIIIRDEEHIEGSRITLERNGRVAPLSITCGISGWMVHTRFFATEIEAQDAFNQMEASLDTILKMIAFGDDAVATKMQGVSQAINDFVEQYP